MNKKNVSWSEVNLEQKGIWKEYLQTEYIFFLFYLFILFVDQESNFCPYF